MGFWGALIMSFFAAAFAALTLLWQLGWHGTALALPFAGFAVIAAAAIAVIRRPGAGLVPPPHVERVIMWSSIGEGVGLFLAGNLVMNLHRRDLLLPAIALVVGLHFLPIARAAAFRPFYLLGGALIAAALAGVLIPAPLGGTLAGFAAAAALGIAAVMAIARDARAKAAQRHGGADPAGLHRRA